MTLGAVTPACRRRLTAHYGTAVAAWLDGVPERLNEAAARWGLRVEGYHDAGHASALVVAHTSAGTPVILKAWFDRDRCVHEIAALRRWEPVNGRVVRAVDFASAVACLELVGGAPGGGPRPAGDSRRVARALGGLHALPAPGDGFPRLDDYLRGEVEPRILRRLRRFAGDLPSRCVALGVNAGRQRRATGRGVLLHADLYQENVMFDGDGVPVFLDPLPMVGDPGFDWAFWIVYYDLARDPVARLCIAAEAGGIPVAVLLPWCLLLCLDGLCYYHETGDDREPRMIEVMGALATAGGPA